MKEGEEDREEEGRGGRITGEGGIGEEWREEMR